MLANRKDAIVFAIPSKGSLYEGTLAFLKAAGVPVRYESERQYTALVSGIENMSVLFQRAEEIPSKVAGGAADIGLTGEDLYREQIEYSDDLLMPMRDLGYGHARLVVAIPNTWIDVTDMLDLGELALSFRMRHHRNLRIATKFPNLSREFLAKHGITDYALVESLGATESAPSSGAADLIIDLTSSGKTMSENHLKMLRDGIVIASQACLIASRRISTWNKDRLKSLETFFDLIESHLRGRDTYNLQAAIRRSKLAELAAQGSHHWHLAYSLPMEGSASSEPKQHDESVVIRVTCRRQYLHRVIRRLRESGASEVIVTQPNYVFKEHSEAFHNLSKMLKKMAGEDQAED
jgi:ATP phosphoribosyltransferase